MPRITIAQHEAVQQELAVVGRELSKLATENNNLREDRRLLQDENVSLRAELNAEQLKVKQMTEQSEAYQSAVAQQQILEKLNQLITAFGVHMNSNTMAVNTLTAAVANLKVGK